MVQLGRLDYLVERRRLLAKARISSLENLSDSIETCCDYGQAKHCFYICHHVLLGEIAQYRSLIINDLKRNFGIKCSIANPPTHLSNKYICEMADVSHLKEMEILGASIFNAPIHPDMPESDNEFISEAIAATVERYATKT